jgi:hypothetical protein
MDMNKIMDISSFKKERPPQFDAAMKLDSLIEGGENFILLLGPLKSGKREIIECLATLRSQKSKVLYTTSLNRNDMKDQYEEFEEHNKHTKNLTTILLAHTKSISNFSNDIQYVAFRDEDDYGDNRKQKWEDFYTKYSSQSNMIWVPTSATPFSLMEVLSRPNHSNIQYVVSQVSPSYNDLDKPVKVVITESALEFHKKNLIGFSPRFTTILTQWLGQNKYPRLIVRESRFDRKKHLVKLDTLLRSLQLRLGMTPKVDCELVDKTNSEIYKWKRNNWNNFELTIVKQTFTRGTETNIQPYLFGYYDHRDDSVAVNTILQPLGRFCGYLPNNHIQLFLSSKAIDMVNANSYMWKELYKGTSLSTILDNLHLQFNLKKLSKNTKQTSHNSNIGTWSYQRVISPPNTPHHSTLHVGTQDKLRIIEAIDQDRHTDGQWHNTPLGTIGYVEIDDIDNVINSISDPNLATTLKNLQSKYNLPLNGKCYLQGTRIKLPYNNIVRANKSVYNHLSSAGLI